MIGPADFGEMRTWAEVDLAVLRSNFEQVRRHARGLPVLAVVKADAYGHGAVAVARELVRLGCQRLGVATAEELSRLRDAGLSLPIHMLGPVPADSLPQLLGKDAVFSVGAVEELSLLAEAASREGARETVHVEIDTGMGRSGLRPDGLGPFIQALRSSPGVELEGVMTHFPSADDPRDPGGADFARRQLEGLKAAAGVLVKAGFGPLCVHAANSAGLACLPESRLSLVRPGGALYGLSVGERTRERLRVRPVLSWRARIVHAKRLLPGEPLGYGRGFVARRRTAVATVAAGYADGYSGRYAAGGAVLLNGRRAPVVGRVSMDSFSVDVTDLDVPPRKGGLLGDEVTLLGAEGSEEITASELAARAGVCAYEVTSCISSRAPRLYRGAEST